MGRVSPACIDLGKTSVRMHTDEDVDLLKWIKKLIDEGITPRTAFERAATHNAEEDR